jgi:hypothetical protein
MQKYQDSAQGSDKGDGAFIQSDNSGPHVDFFGLDSDEITPVNSTEILTSPLVNGRQQTICYHKTVSKNLSLKSQQGEAYSRPGAWGIWTLPEPPVCSTGVPSSAARPAPASTSRGFKGQILLASCKPAGMRVGCMQQWWGLGELHLQPDRSAPS